MRNQVTEVKPGPPRVLRVSFADGFEGTFDVAPDIARFEMFAPLADDKLFAKVAIGGGGYRVGWLLDDFGNEIDYSSETVRNELETAAVRSLAKDHRARLEAAE